MSFCDENTALFATSNELCMAFNYSIICTNKSSLEDKQHQSKVLKQNNIIRTFYITDEIQGQNAYGRTYLLSAQFLQNCFALCFKAFQVENKANNEIK